MSLATCLSVCLFAVGLIALASTVLCGVSLYSTWSQRSLVGRIGVVVWTAFVVLLWTTATAVLVFLFLPRSIS